jgi:hypothetical protein
MQNLMMGNQAMVQNMNKQMQYQADPMRQL